MSTHLGIVTDLVSASTDIPSLRDIHQTLKDSPCPLCRIGGGEPQFTSRWDRGCMVPFRVEGDHVFRVRGAYGSCVAWGVDFNHDVDTVLHRQSSRQTSSMEAMS